MEKMTRNSNTLKRYEPVMADSDLVDFLNGSMDSAINFSGWVDLHTPIHPPYAMFSNSTLNNVTMLGSQVGFSQALPS